VSWDGFRGAGRGCGAAQAAFAVRVEGFGDEGHLAHAEAPFSVEKLRMQPGERGAQLRLRRQPGGAVDEIQDERELGKGVMQHGASAAIARARFLRFPAPWFPVHARVPSLWLSFVPAGFSARFHK
jgi:hypothetical protein